MGKIKITVKEEFRRGFSFIETVKGFISAEVEIALNLKDTEIICVFEVGTSENIELFDILEISLNHIS